MAAFEIHAFIDYEDDCGNTWSFADGPLLLPRQDSLFAALAGVNAEAGRTPLFPPRGLPPKYSDAVHTLFFDLICEAEEAGRKKFTKYISPAEADRRVVTGRSFYAPDATGALTYVSDPDWHHASWLTLSELWTAFDHIGLLPTTLDPHFLATMAAMAQLSHHYGEARVRLVFWFAD